MLCFFQAGEIGIGSGGQEGGGGSGGQEGGGAADDAASFNATAAQREM